MIKVYEDSLKHIYSVENTGSVRQSDYQTYSKCEEVGVADGNFRVLIDFYFSPFICNIYHKKLTSVWKSTKTFFTVVIDN